MRWKNKCQQILPSQYISINNAEKVLNRESSQFRENKVFGVFYKKSEEN